MKRSSQIPKDLPGAANELSLSETKALEILRANHFSVDRWWNYVTYFVVEGPSIRVTLVGTSALATFALGILAGSSIRQDA